MADLDKAIRDELPYSTGGVAHLALTAVLDACRELDRRGHSHAATHVRHRLARALGVTRVSSQGTPPAPRPARVWQEDAPNPAEEGLVIRDADGDVAVYRNGHWGWTVVDGERVEPRPWSWPAGDMAYPATEVLSEVVVPSGTDGDT